jgi:hypothetical protein
MVRPGLRPSGDDSNCKKRNLGDTIMKSWKIIDLSSSIIIALTLFLFIGAIFLKGITKDILLETGVFLVSLKIIMMIYKNKVMENEIKEKLNTIEKLIKEKDGIN